MARAAREAEAAERRFQREQERARRERLREDARAEKAAKAAYLDGRAREAEDGNADLSETLTALREILEHTLRIDDTIAFDSLRIRDAFRAFALPTDLRSQPTAPVEADILGAVKPPNWFERLFGLRKRYERDLGAAKDKYASATAAFQRDYASWRSRVLALQREHESAREAFERKKAARNQDIDEFELAYRAGEQSAVIQYNEMVLDRSDYPDGFPKAFRVAYVPAPKELVIEYQLPTKQVVPAVAEYRYTKSKDAIDEKPRKAGEIKEIYSEIVAAVALRTIHEVLEADQCGLLQVVVFNGFVKDVDPATGRDIAPHLVSVRTTRDRFLEIDLARVDKRTCLRNLGAQVSPRPEELQAVKPIVEFDMVDRRFIEQGDVLGTLDARPNLMDLSPSEFEILVGNLFGKMGLESKLTRASRDGGVDVVAFDRRPILGGKVVIQAKRYRNVVGVSAVRDLYGTVMNEGASKGILVATSHYGPDAYEFAKEKPIELIDGGGLIYMLEEVGTRVRIIMPIDPA